MLHRLRLFTFFLLFSSLSVGYLNAQSYTGETVNFQSNAVSEQLTSWETYRIDAPGLSNFVRNNINQALVDLKLGSHHWTVNLTPSEIVYPGSYTLQVLTDSGLETSTPMEHKAFKGYELASGGQVRLTLDDDFIYGYIRTATEMYLIEPLWYLDPTASHDLFVVYNRNAVIRSETATCATVDLEDAHDQYDQAVKDKIQSGSPEFMACYQLDLAIASDHLMLAKYGSVGGVEDHNIGVINDVEGDYTGSFNNDVHFNIVTQFVSSSATTWSTSTDANILLTSFRAWGQAGNFGVQFDLGQLWTNRNFDGDTVGIAYLNAVCTSNKYHCLQDFTTNSEQLRCMTSHEIGHNFSCQHDSQGCPPNFIMCPFVSNSATWSTTSTNSVNNFMVGLINNGCLSLCGPPPGPLVADFTWNPNPVCRGQAVQFTDLSTGGITGRSWVFTGGTPATSTQQNPTVVWNSVGTFNAKLTLTGPGGPVMITKQVVVLPLPTANFSFTVSGLSVNFTSTSTNGTTYLWDFGDGNTSTEQNPFYGYLTGGMYTVVLSVTNGCATVTKTLVVNTAPVAGFSALPTSGCASLPVQFTNESSPNVTSYLWQFPGGIPAVSNQPNPVVFYANGGTFSVTLNVSNPSGSNSVTKAGYITVQNAPNANFTANTVGQTTTFTNTSIGGTTFAWNFGDGQTSTTASPVHTYATGGAYSVVLTVTNNCGTATKTVVVQIAGAPSAGFTATTTTGCAPLTVTFSNQTTGENATYTWQFPGGNPSTSTAQNPVVTYSTAGTYTVTLTATNNAGTNTSTQSNFVTVYTTPTAGFTSTTTASTATFTNTTTPGGTPPANTTYAWNFGDNSTGTTANPAHTYAADGTYTVTLTATNICGTNTFTQTVTIATPPTANFTATPTAGCAPLTVQFTSTSSANTVGYAWQFPGGTPSTSMAQNPSVVYASAGVYAVTLTVSNTAGTHTAAQTNYISVNTTPVPAFTSSTSGTTVAFANTSSNAVSYAWNFGDAGTSTAANPSHTYAADGTYTVVLSATNACGTTTSSQIVVIATPPSAGFTAMNTTGCAPLSVQFTNASSVNATTYNWQFPGGSPSSSTAQNPTVVYPTAGVYSVTLTASNTTGTSTATQSNLVTVTTTPTASFTNNTAGSTTSFTNTSANATTYTWSFGDGGNSTAASPSHTYATDGTYTVTLTATNACGTTTATQSVVIVLPPTASFTASTTSGCVPLTVQFTSTSSANTTAYSWQFPGGNPGSSTAPNPSVTYATPGMYSVVLTAGNAAGTHTATQTNLISVGAAPVAAFGSTIAGVTATFTNTTSGATSYIWDFGDGAGSIQANPTHQYATDGAYNVVLTATNACGMSTFTQPVVVITSPSAGFTANTTTGCAELTVNFTDLSSGNTTGWNWEFPGGTPATSTQKNPSVVYSVPGTYTVTLVASTSAGTSTYMQTNFITVLNTPTAGFSSAVNGATASFVNGSTDATSYSWNFGDGGTSALADPSHVYANDGIYTVILTASNNCGSVTFTQPVTIATPPAAGFTTGVLTGCAPFSAQFTNQSTANATTYAWTFEGGNPAVSAEVNPIVTWTATGVYKVTLVASNALGSTTATATIAVTGLPTPGFTSVTAGLSIVVTNTSVNAISYLWEFGDGSTSTETSPTHAYAGVGTYTVILRATNACGTIVSTSTVVINGSAPLANFATEDPAGCVPFTVVFNDQSAGNPTSWQWSFPGGNPASSIEQNPTVTYATPGLYSVTLKVVNVYGSNTKTQDNFIQALGVPVAAFTTAMSQNTVSFTNQSQNATSYSWNFGDGSGGLVAEPTHTFALPGTYTVELTATNICGASTLQQTIVVVTTGTVELDWLQSFRLFPNPNTGSFTLEMVGEPQDDLTFTLFNSLGQQVRREVADFKIGTLNRVFDYQDLPAAVYALQIQGGTKTVFVKVVVAR